MSSTCSVPPRDLVSVEVAAEQVGAHPQTLLTGSTFPVRYPVRAPERGPQMANPRPTPKPGNLGPPWPPYTSGNMSSTCSVLPRDLVSVEVAAEQVGAYPQTLLTRSTFPVHYPVLAPERVRQMANPRPTPKPEDLRPPWPPGTSGNPAGYSRGRPLRGLKMIVGSLGIPWG